MQLVNYEVKLTNKLWSNLVKKPFSTVKSSQTSTLSDFPRLNFGFLECAQKLGLPIILIWLEYAT